MTKETQSLAEVEARISRIWEESARKSTARFERIEADLKEVAEGLKRIERAQEKDEMARLDMRKELSGVGRTQGEIAEDFFYYNGRYAFEDAGIEIIKYGRTEISSITKREYDIIAESVDCVIAVEVKARLRKEYVGDFVEKITGFLKDFPEYRKKKIYGAVAGMAIDRGVKALAERSGLLLMTQDGSMAAQARKPGGKISNLCNFGRSGK